MTTPVHWLTVTTAPATVGMDGRACRTRAAFFAEAARALGVPVPAGPGWDVLADAVRGLGAVDVVVAHAEELLADEPPAQFAVLLDIAAAAAPEGLTLTLNTGQDHETALRHRIANALVLLPGV
ncbi:barstar family protein [Actinophytocola glycyrrhizae]|uniref:Barstar family protein n=1 Tax=Actinophytocola glycyrrhizae TaxID=2044873 RepID=A0ABV9S2W4_9PSEU